VNLEHAPHFHSPYWLTSF